MPQVIRNIYFIFGMFFCSYEQGTDKYPRRQGINYSFLMF